MTNVSDRVVSFDDEGDRENSDENGPEKSRDEGDEDEVVLVHEGVVAVRKFERVDPVEVNVGVNELVTIAKGMVVLDGVDVVVFEAVGEMLAGAFAKSAG